MQFDTLLAMLATPWCMGLIGLCIGSFLNVVIHRLPKMLERQWRVDSSALLEIPVKEEPELNLVKPASRCPSCGHLIRWYENIPLLSWLFLRGKCSACKTPISIRYPLVELATALLFAATSWRFNGQPVTLVWAVFVSILVAASMIDWDTTLLPDDLTFPLLWAGLLAALFGWTIPLNEAVTGAMVGYLSLWAVYWLFKLTTGKEGMGYGDFKLLAALGAWLGWQMVLPVVLGSSIIGAVVGIIMKVSSQLREGRYVPYGPFLAGAGLGIMLAGPQKVLEWLGWA
ncbi:A24 family peptidase [Aquabacterium sp.]|uniref:prepilin peptidase n=1 Tax=Aquabacterium sp. TaxID=1872578 RepID=UPI0035B40434